MRAFRHFSNLRGWRRFSNAVAKSHGEFVIRNEAGYFSGDLSSFIERQIYLYGGYEREMIAMFLDAIPRTRRDTVLDVGANIGTHSIAFARHFRQVHAFEPSPQVWPSLERNIAMNSDCRIALHNVALGNSDRVSPLYTIENTNLGLGTLVPETVYTVPVKECGEVRIVDGSSYLERIAVDRVDAIKVDVQGYELTVLDGLQQVLKKNRPYIWIEISQSEADSFGTAKAFLDLIPYRANLQRLVRTTNLVKSKYMLVPYRAGTGRLAGGDHLISPA